MTKMTKLSDMPGMAILAEELNTWGLAIAWSISGPLTLETLLAVFDEDDTPRRWLAAWLVHTWSETPQPTLALDRAVWIDMFRRVGYIDLVDPLAERNLEPLRMYRGATPEHARGMSWTQSRAVASGYGQVWTAEVPPEAILARLPHFAWTEEYVVDLPDYVEVVEDVE
jgi:hypothetical protein